MVATSFLSPLPVYLVGLSWAVDLLEAWVSVTDGVSDGEPMSLACLLVRPTDRPTGRWLVPWPGPGRKHQLFRFMSSVVIKASEEAAVGDLFDIKLF